MCADRRSRGEVCGLRVRASWAVVPCVKPQPDTHRQRVPPPLCPATSLSRQAALGGRRGDGKEGWPELQGGLMLVC